MGHQTRCGRLEAYLRGERLKNDLNLIELFLYLICPRSVLISILYSCGLTYLERNDLYQQRVIEEIIANYYHYPCIYQIKTGLRISHPSERRFKLRRRQG
jgi:hypothetical protein